MYRLFKKGHRHKWKKETRTNKRIGMMWRLRSCECGAVEMLNGGGGGDKKWHPFNGEFKFDWEKLWFEEAV